VSDRIEFPPLDADEARVLLADAYQAISTALALNAQLAARMDRGTDDEAHRLNDALFLALNDAKQRLEMSLGGRPDMPLAGTAEENER
jgi:hypothetical protein